MQHGGDISPPRPAYKYLSQGIPLKSLAVLIINKNEVMTEQKAWTLRPPRRNIAEKTNGNTPFSWEN